MRGGFLISLLLFVSILPLCSFQLATSRPGPDADSTAATEYMTSEPGLSKTEEVVLMAMFMADGAWNQLGLSQEEGLNLLSEYIKTLRFDDSEDIAKVIRKELYLYMRNTLMTTRKGDLFYLQNHPVFSNWGRANMIQLAQNYSRGGQQLLRETVTRIFHAGWQSDKPELPMIGFDENLGTSKETAITIYNAPSHEDGIEAEYWYLHYKFGKARKDWDLERQMLVKDQENNKAYDLLHIRFPNDTTQTVYFDISEFYSE
jgi:hypothetical protein